MTGYGKAELELSGKKISIEIKSLNSKQIDLNVRIPYVYNEKELTLRALLSKRLERGKVSFYMNSESVGAHSDYSINKELAAQYFNELREVAQMVHAPEGELLAAVTRLPDVVKQADESVDAQEWEQIMQKVEEALEKMEAFRLQEGETLEQDFRMRIAAISKLLEQVAPFEESRTERVKNKLNQELIKAVDEGKIDRNRFEQELIFYLEKFDITEEKVRLKKHCDYFLETLDNPQKSKGKKLGFILQEIGREINTLGSKANEPNLQQIVVQMKDELEKIKEQSLNIL
jgi:uncharacterized protein (TIGR00255 family)